MSPSTAKQWRHLLHAVLHRAWAHPALLPARNAAEGALLLATQQTARVPPLPLVGMMALRDRAIARPIQRNHKHTPGARKRATRSHTSACSMRPVTGAACVTRWQARNMTNAARIWPVRPCHAGVTALTIGDSRAFWGTGAR